MAFELAKKEIKVCGKVFNQITFLYSKNIKVFPNRKKAYTLSNPKNSYHPSRPYVTVIM